MSDINIGALSEAINDKMDRDLNNRSDDSGLRKLVESYINGASWYKIFDEIQSDGTVKKWCEQGGSFTNSGDTTQTISFLKPFVDTSYYFNRCNESTVTGTATSFASEGYSNKTVTSISLYSYRSVTNVYWKAEGYIS